MTEIRFTLPGRPTAWARAGGNAGADGRGARKFTPHNVRAAQKAIKVAAKLAMGNRPLLATAVRVTVECVYAVPQSWKGALREAALEGAIYRTSVPDIDNLEKMVMDALNLVVWHDDAQVAELLGAKRYGLVDETRVWIRSIGENAPLTPSLVELAKVAAQHPHGRPAPARKRRAPTLANTGAE